MSHETSSRPNASLFRVAVVCAEEDLLGLTVKQLLVEGAEVTPLSRLSDVATTRARCDVVLLFTEGYPTRELHACLEALDAWRAGPALVVVTHPGAALWGPSVVRDQPVLVVTRATWAREEGLAWLEHHVAKARERAREEEYASRPELPFTD